MPNNESQSALPMRETAPTETELRIATIEARQTTLGAEGWQVPSVTGGHTLSVAAQDLLYADVPWLIAELREARQQATAVSDALTEVCQLIGGANGYDGHSPWRDPKAIRHRVKMWREWARPSSSLSSEPRNG